MKSIFRTVGILLLSSLPLVIACNGKENPVKEAATIKADKTEITLGYEAGSAVINVDQNQGYTARVSNGSEWLSAEPSSDYKTLTVKVAENEGEARTGEVTLTQDAAMWKIAVYQEAAPAKGENDIRIAFSHVGDMPDMGMRVYAFGEGAFKDVPEGRIVILKFKTMDGQVRLMDSNNEAKLYRNITDDLTVAIPWGSLAEDLAAGGRVLIIGEGALENELQSITVTRSAELPFTLQGEMPDMGMKVYALSADTFKDVEEGDVVVLSFKSIGATEGDVVTPDQIRLMDGNNEAKLYRNISDDCTVAYFFVGEVKDISRILIIGKGALQNELTHINYAKGINE